MPGIDECLLEAMTLPGARGAAVVDWVSGLALGTAGEAPNGSHETAATETAELARMAVEHSVFAPRGETGDWGAGAGAGTGGAGSGGAGSGGAGGEEDKAPFVEDIIVCTRSGFHLMRFVETTFDSSVFLHLWLEGHQSNLALSRIRLRHMAERLVLL